ncbi:FHIPEP family protein [Treponema bryantii]|uniref:FHIPEP family protein n=1 Tax=Treponema bryantii TaxID=163 RepID=A0A1I3LJ48_9SPIR|nr:FHIPEP family type III secretion protein [Treponema bryantii]SFI84774.1 FHIPEP family protein [Treponema bryantii]
MAVSKRRRSRNWRKIHPYEDYRDFGQQPFELTLEIGYALIPLVDHDDSDLLAELKYLRNEMDGEYGLPLPVIHIRDNMCLEPNEYRLLLHGAEIAKSEARPGYCLCLDTGCVTKELEGEKTKDPAFGIDAIIIPKEKEAEARNLGYVIADWGTVIRAHLTKVIKKNFTKFLDQCMVNTLINKVRDRNPDVVDDVFFIHNFSTSKLKTILNWLLEEGVSIRDMNTILETIADNLEETKRLSELMEKVREKLAYQFLQKIADDNKRIHVIRVSQALAEALSERIYYPGSNNELPYYAFTPVENKEFNNRVSEKARCLSEKGYSPVFVIVRNLRTALSNNIRQSLGNWTCISDTELYSVIKDYSIVVEEELEADEIKVNEPCLSSN